VHSTVDMTPMLLGSNRDVQVNYRNNQGLRNEFHLGVAHSNGDLKKSFFKKIYRLNSEI